MPASGKKQLGISIALAVLILLLLLILYILWDRRNGARPGGVFTVVTPPLSSPPIDDVSDVGPPPGLPPVGPVWESLKDDRPVVEVW